MSKIQLQNTFRGLNDVVVKLSKNLLNVAEELKAGNMQHLEYVNSIKTALDDLVQTEEQMRATLMLALEFVMTPDTVVETKTENIQPELVFEEFVDDEPKYVNEGSVPVVVGQETYYRHPDFWSIAVSREGKIIKAETKESISARKDGQVSYRSLENTHSNTKLRRILATLFVPNPEGLKFAGRRFKDDHSVSVENTIWTNGGADHSISSLLHHNGSLLKVFSTQAEAIAYAVSDPVLRAEFKLSKYKMRDVLCLHKKVVSSNGHYVLTTA